MVLALQDRPAYGPTFDSAMKALFGGEASSLSAATGQVQAAQNAEASAARPKADRDALISGTAKDLAEYQRLTAQGKLGEAGRKLEELKQKLDELNAHQK